ncbi:MAG: NepR family anti-sigma factor [Paracoccaceae bacterium]
MKRQIDENLKRIYDETLQEEVPDRFKQLLEQLRQKTDGGKL